MSLVVSRQTAVVLILMLQLASFAQLNFVCCNTTAVVQTIDSNKIFIRCLFQCLLSANTEVQKRSQSNKCFR